MGAVGVDAEGVWVRFLTYDNVVEGHFDRFYTVSHEMRWIPPGTFLMGESPIPGSPNYDPDCPQGAPLAQWVTITKGFWMGRYPVTVGQYRQFCRVNGLRFLGVLNSEAYRNSQSYLLYRCPVVSLSEEDIMGYCQWLSSELGLQVTLPTEAQWEYAARGSDGRKYPWGNDPPSRERASYMFLEPHVDPVGQKPLSKSPFGVEEMAGTVLERCSLVGKNVDNPAFEGTPFRGGGCRSTAYDIRAAKSSFQRSPGSLPDLTGFRIVIPSFRF